MEIVIFPRRYLFFVIFPMEVVVFPGKMYQVLFMETLEIANGIFSGSDFVEVTFSGTSYVPIWKKL